MTSPLFQAPAIYSKEGVNLAPNHLHALDFALALALTQALGATTTIMLTTTIASQVHPPSMGIHPSMGMCTSRTMMMDITITQTKAILSLPLSLLQKQRRNAPRNRESCQQRN